MALIEQDREDLFRDGRAMPVRGEVLVSETPWLVGFRASGQLSLYAGPDRVYQFNAHGQLRRMFIDGKRYAAEQRELHALATDQRGGRLSWNRTPLTTEEHSRLLASLATDVARLDQLLSGPMTTWRVVGAEASEFRARVQQWLAAHAQPIVIAESANA